MNTIVTKQVYGDAKKILKTHSVVSSSFLTDLSETTLRRIKRSTSFPNYKLLMKLDNPNRKLNARKASSAKPAKKVQVKSTRPVRSSVQVRVSETPQKPVKKSWRQRIFG